MKVKFTVLGEPRGKGRPKFTSRGGFAKAYTPKETVNYEMLVRLEYERCYANQMFGKDEQLSLNVMSFHKIPQSTSKKKRNQMLSGEIRPTKKPDMDNIIKIIADGLNGVAYYDDKQIVDAAIHKFYSDNPRVVVEIINVGIVCGFVGYPQDDI